MKNTYEITLFDGNGYNINGHVKYLHLNVFENDHDINIKRYSFTSDLTNDEDYSDETNWCINYLLLEIYNGGRILCGHKPFMPHYMNNQLKSLDNHVKAYEAINKHIFDSNSLNAKDTEFTNVMRIIMESKNLRDLSILLNRVTLQDENSLINLYKIKDFIRTYKDLFSKYNQQYKDEIKRINAVYKSLDKYHRLVNNYLTIGLAARHGLQTQSPTKKDYDINEIIKVSIEAIQLVINFSKRNILFNIDNLVELDLNNK
ncbi:hypothetical protein [Mammaliicoccus sciuri]|uniref:hypothetical protein n=1 Tax=Mammaliicoccus sciuri TaxID=1296 RepID=UPI001951F505|nr:hypothetical protein [Mammaliicoccus sciuri]